MTLSFLSLFNFSKNYSRIYYSGIIFTLQVVKINIYFTIFTINMSVI